MKYTLLLSTLLSLSFAAHAQQWINPLPLDSASGYVTYQGKFTAPSQSQQQTLARATRYARIALTDKPSFLVDSSKADEPIVRGAGARVFRWRGGAAGATGRVLHYDLLLRPRAGYYEYELTDLINETPAVQVQVAAGAATTLAPRRGPVEAVLRSPIGYDKKGRPTAPQRSYCEAVNETVQAVLNDARAALGAR